MANIFIRICIVLILLSMKSIDGLERDHWGNHFILTFLANHLNDTDTENEIVITTKQDVNVYVIFHETNIEQYFELAAETSKIILYDTNTTARPFHRVLPRKAVSVEASSNISVYGFVNSEDHGDGFLVLPVLALGKEYISVNCNQTGGSQIAIAAAEDSTNVTINVKPELNSTCKMYQNQTPHSLGDLEISFTLAAYDVFNIYCEKDLTGSLIISTHPVAVFSGCACGKTGEYSHCDHLNEMLPPVSNFGNTHIIVAHETYNTVFFRIVTVNDTTIMINNEPENVKSRDFIDWQTHSSVKIESNQSVLVTMTISLGSKTHGHVPSGGPLMMIVPPINKYTKQYVVKTPVNEMYRNFSVIITIGTLYIPTSQAVWSDNHDGYTYRISSDKDAFIKYDKDNPLCLLIYSNTKWKGIGYPGGMETVDFSGSNECAYNPCKNNGWCLEVSMGYRCRCTQHFTGINCHIENTTAETTYTTQTPSTNTTGTTITTAIHTNYTTETTNTTEMSTINTKGTTHTTEMPTANNTESTYTTRTPTTNTRDTTDTTEIPTINTTDMSTTNTTEMPTTTTTEMLTKNTTETTDTTESTYTTGVPNTNTTETIYSTETVNTTETRIFNTTTDGTVDDTTGTESITNANQTDIPSSSPINSHQTSKTSDSAPTKATTSTPNTITNITSTSSTTRVYTTTDISTGGKENNDSKSHCSINEITTNLNLTAFFLKCNDTLYWCDCPCPSNRSYVDLLKRLTNQYQRLLLLDAELLGKTIRKKTSAINYYDSQTYLGVSSVGITLIFLSSVILLDLTKLIKWFCERYRGQKIRFVRKRRPF